MAKLAFRLEASFDKKTGHVVAVSLRVREGSVANTKEVAQGEVYADYDSEGLLLGIELLGPCQVSVLESIAENESEPIGQFLREGVPRELVSA